MTTTIHADNATDCKNWLDTITETNTTTIDDITAELHTLQHEEGPTPANRIWFTPLLDQWLHNLENKQVDMDADTLIRLAVSMNETLPMRDALLLSLIADMSRDQLLTIAIHHNSNESRTLVARYLGDALLDTGHADHDRIQAGVTMLSALAETSPEPLKAHPYAGIAYVLWYLNDERATVFALRALASNEDCSLAGIVMAFIQQGAHPNDVH